MERRGTAKRIRVAAEIDSDVIAMIDAERKGLCSRAAIIRMALGDRYAKRKTKRAA